ncbi:MAG: hypothetical protein NC126_04240, partial [Clostridium sp.]|nr:hypothetical protein [Clostridium sp.]
YRNKQFLQEMSWQYAYDAHGNEVKNLYYSQKGRMQSGWEREYGENGELTKCIRYHNGEMLYQEEYGYDENGRTLWFTHRYNDELAEYHEEYDWRKEYEYDENGSQTEYRQYDKEGELLYRCTYEYDGGMPVKSITYDKYGKKEEYQYGSFGNLVKDIRYGADGEIDRWEEWQYNDKGEVIKDVSYDADGQAVNHKEYEYQCDAAGNVIQYTEFEIYGGERQIVMRFDNAYDNEGRLVRSIEYEGKDILSRKEIRYEHDDAEPDKAEHDNAYHHKETTYFYQDGRMDSWTEREYNQRGYTLKYAAYYSDGRLTSLCEMEYDENEVRRKKIMYDGDGSIIEWYEYNEAGHATKELVYDADKNLLKWDEYQYDPYGNCVHIDCFDEEGNVVKQEDKNYDALGNLTGHTFRTSDEEIVYTHINAYRLMGTWQRLPKNN